MVSFLARAFRRLGCEVFVAGGPTGSDEGSDGYVDPVFVEPVVRAGGPNVGLGGLVAAVGGDISLAVMVDQGSRWAVQNDGSCGKGFAYIWREANLDEDRRVIPAAAGAPIFQCMVGQGKATLETRTFMPFAVDREVFSGGKPWKDREFALVYTGRERGNGTWGWLKSRLEAHGHKVMCTAYVDGYKQYSELLANSSVSYFVDPRYVGSRGIEALAQGCVVFCDGIGIPGTAHELAGLSQVCRKLNPVIDKATGEFVPTDEFIQDALQVLDWPEEQASAYSAWCRQFILANHTYESRAITIAKACGLTLPKTIEEIE